MLSTIEFESSISNRRVLPSFFELDMSLNDLKNSLTRLVRTIMEMLLAKHSKRPLQINVRPYLSI